jgi:FkbM family methyltransferase
MKQWAKRNFRRLVLWCTAPLYDELKEGLAGLRKHVAYESEAAHACMNAHKEDLEGLRRHVAHESAAANARMNAHQEEFLAGANKIEEVKTLFHVSAQEAAVVRGKLARLEELEFNLFSEKPENIYGTTSYAQSGEDRIAAFIIKSMVGPMHEVTYLDLGANHAKAGSNTYLFYKHGARGVLVEANPALIPELRFYRNGDIVLNHCITAKDCGSVPFYVLGTSVLTGHGLSTADYATAQAALKQNPEMHITTVDVRTTTANDIMAYYFGQAPTIVSIDIEGMEMEILRSIDYTLYRPLIFILETIPYTHPYQVSERNRDIVAFMQQNNYVEYAFTGINSVFIDAVWLRENQRLGIKVRDDNDR